MTEFTKILPILPQLLITVLLLPLFASIFVAYVIGGHIYKRLDQPGAPKQMRQLCRFFQGLFVLFAAAMIMQLVSFALFAAYRMPATFFMFGFTSFLGLIFVNATKDYCRYYLKNRDDNKVVADWHMQKYFAAANNKEPEEAYRHLKKAAELQSESVFIWSMMSWYNEYHFEQSKVADEYLAKARQTLDALPYPTAKDKAIIESVAGEILLHRNQIDEGLAKVKAACELDPSEYNCKTYEEAVRWANEPDDDNELPFD